ncbi:hypothetical protein Poli38472_005075 [Pythium oligandrum]|uniref:Metalloendopeptidase n=1 Tax=Pythium oligandrum TaxID=41045 RepID=A0A8K1CHZ6_PYTOL|nr:hypothetical protein Poli38472_005075 [Pythium oligandrum]|eukprot:TMW62457.1 hypothetical protein Poli38472_005075 [Pythium oligandrum]
MRWQHAALVAVSALYQVQASFYVCPAPCKAMLLPREMDTLADCVCPGNDGGVLHDNNQQKGALFQCPEGSAATRLHPLSFADCACLSGFTRDQSRKVCSADEFECLGRYKLRKDADKAESIADCDCIHPYKKDDATGSCELKTCPRAGNYIKKSGARHVTSLADCACIEPYVKDDQSGECLVSSPYECPAYSLPTPNRRPQSFADCHCDFGFVRTPDDTCERESLAFACPINSVPRADLTIGQRPRSFADCLCEQTGEFVRNDATHSCDRIKKRNKNGDLEDGDVDEEYDSDFRCPPFSHQLAPYPHSVEQCECLPGFGWKTPEMTCVRMSGYKCPAHSFKADDNLHIEANFADCECARGFFRDETNQVCVEWFLANNNGCPKYTFLRHWPLQSKANCQCIYGFKPTPMPTEGAIETPDLEEEITVTDPKERRKQLRQQRMRRKHRLQQHPKKKPAPECNAPMEMGGVSFSQCPPHSFATTWPVASPDDCTCVSGYKMGPMFEDERDHGDGEGFRCVPAEQGGEAAEDDQEDDEDTETITDSETTPACRAPLVKSPYNGECRLPVEEVVPRSPRDRGTVLFKGIEYDYVLTDDDVMIVQGDIAIGTLERWPGMGDEVNSDSATPILHGYFNSERDHRWPNAAMCYEIDSSAKAFSSQIRDAMDHIHAVTNFAFTQCRGNQCVQDSGCGGDYVSIKLTSSSCFSYIGRIGGAQSLGVSAECGVGNLMHVLLHAVGLHHAVDRTDRDDHVRIAWECLPDDKRSYFIVEELNMTLSPMDTPYDFYSIMHHPPNAFVRSDDSLPKQRFDASSRPPSWCQSVFPIITDPEERVGVLSKMGQRELMAVTDIHAVWRLYPTLQTQETPFYASGQKNAPISGAEEVFESRLHTQDDVMATLDDFRMKPKRSGRSFARKLGSFFGAIATLVGFGAFMAFAMTEFRKRALRNDGSYYSESLLADKALYD